MAFSPLKDEQRKEVKAFLIEKGVLSSLSGDFDKSFAGGFLAHHSAVFGIWWEPEIRKYSKIEVAALRFRLKRRKDGGEMKKKGIWWLTEYLID